MAAITADIIVVFHFIYVLFVVGGAVVVVTSMFIPCAPLRKVAHLKRFRLTHLGAIGFVAIEAIFGIWCPLTVIEHNLRVQAGQRSESAIPFMVRLIRRVMYYDLPLWVFTTAYVLLAGTMVLLYFLYPPDSQESSQQGRHPKKNDP